MAFLQLSHAPPVLEKLKAIWMPETMIPAKRPFTAFLLNSMPTTKGANMTRAPGAIILLSEAFVEMAMHRSGSDGSPSFILMNYYLISAIISLAASPTAAIVKAEKA